MSARRPALTAAPRDGVRCPRAGTEEWLRRGPNQRIGRSAAWHSAPTAPKETQKLSLVFGRPDGGDVLDVVTAGHVGRGT